MSAYEYPAVFYIVPLSTLTSIPVMLHAASESKNATVSATDATEVAFFNEVRL